MHITLNKIIISICLILLIWGSVELFNIVKTQYYNQVTINSNLLEDIERAEYKIYELREAHYKALDRISTLERKVDRKIGTPIGDTPSLTNLEIVNTYRAHQIEIDEWLESMSKEELEKIGYNKEDMSLRDMVELWLRKDKL